MGKTYKELTLEYLRTHEWMTPMDAILTHGNTKLATTISELIRVDQYDITKEFVKSENGKRYMRYHLNG